MTALTTAQLDGLDDVNSIRKLKWDKEAYVPMDIYDHLVAIARAALAWSEADDTRRDLAKRCLSDGTLMAEFLTLDDDEIHPSDQAVADTLRALRAAVRGRP